MSVESKDTRDEQFLERVSYEIEEIDSHLQCYHEAIENVLFSARKIRDHLKRLEEVSNA